MIVVDASVLVPALVDDGDDGRRARAALMGEALAAPALVDLEFVSAVRRLVAEGTVPVARAEQALADLVDLPIERVTHEALVPRCWALRENLTPYDAAYVVLAEALDVRLVTGDERLAAAPGPACRMELLT